MSPAHTTIFLLLFSAGLALPASASPASDMVGTYTLKSSTAVVRVNPKIEGGLMLEIDGQLRGISDPHQDDKPGWTFHVSGEPFDHYSTPLELRVLGNGDLRGRWQSGPMVVQRLDFKLKRAVLVLPNFEGQGADTTAFLKYAKDVARYYHGKGYASRITQAQGSGHLIHLLRTAGEEGKTYSRVVIIAHGGWDGPMFGEYGYQVGPTGEEWHRMPDLAEALRWGTSVDAKVYSSSCHAAGNNRYERGNPYVWTDDLALRSERTVAGPMGSTSTEYTLTQVKAVLEGEGRTLQETRVASPEGRRRIRYKGRLRDAPLTAVEPIKMPLINPALDGGRNRGAPQTSGMTGVFDH